MLRATVEEAVRTQTDQLGAPPLVDLSVVIPAFNAAEYLRATLESVVSQTGVAFDIHVVDDGSSDDTANIAASFAPLVHCHRIANSGGPSRPRNVGVEVSSGEFVAFFDADDLMLPGKLLAAVNALRAHPRAGFLFTDFRGIDADSACFRESWLAEYTTFREDLSPLGPERLHLLPHDCGYSRLLRTNFVGTSSVVCRRAALAQAGLFDETMRNADDIDMWMRLAWHGWDLLFLDEVYHCYRKTSTGVTSRGSDRYPDMIKGMEKQLTMVRNSADRQCVRARLGRLWLEYAYGLRLGRNYTASRAAYVQSLKFARSLLGLLGLVRSIFHSYLRRENT
jgi:glycosyltransferase involved in cell wall biosynthesis